MKDIICGKDEQQKIMDLRGGKAAGIAMGAFFCVGFRR